MTLQLLEPTPDLAAQARRDLTDEYVAIGSYDGADLVMSQELDDITARFGPEIYDRMLTDPEVSARMELIKIATLGDGLSSAPAVRADDTRYARAREVEKFLSWNLKRIKFRQFAYEMLDALPYGHKVAEVTYEVAQDGPYKDRLVLKSIKVKPRNSVAFVVDPFLDIKGFLTFKRNTFTRGLPLAPFGGIGSGIGGNYIGAVTGVTPDAIAGPVNSVAGNMDDDRRILPRIKFAVLTFRGRDNDPRGQSILRPCYNAWNFKQKLYPEWMLFMCQTAQPSVIGIAPPDNTTAIQAATSQANEPAMNDRTGKQETDNAGKPKFQTAVQRLGSILAKLRKVYAAAVPNGTTFEVVESKNDGSAFIKALDGCDRAITTAMVLATLGVREGQYMSRNAGSLHASVVDTFIWFVKGLFLDMLVEDVCKVLLQLNEPDDALDLMPLYSLGDTQRSDWSKEASAAAQLLNTKQLPPRVLQDILVQLGFQPLDAEELAQLIEARAAQIEASKEAPGNTDTGEGNKKPVAAAA